MSQVTIEDFITSDIIAAAFPASYLLQILDDPVNPCNDLTNAALVAREDFQISRVNGEIRSALAVRHTLPLTVDSSVSDDVINTLSGFALDMFVYYARAVKDHVLDEQTLCKYKAATIWLDAVAKGTRLVGTTDTQLPPRSQFDRPHSTEHRKTFTRERLRGF